MVTVEVDRVAYQFSQMSVNKSFLKMLMAKKIVSNYVFAVHANMIKTENALSAPYYEYVPS